MRLTIINQYYRPDISPTATLAASLAEHRAEMGDEVTVVTSRGNYVSGGCDRGNDRGGNPRIIRLWTPGFGKGRRIGRLLDYGAFYLLAAWSMLTGRRQDAIVAMTTPPFIAWAAVLHKIFHPWTRLVLWNMDCYPEVAERAGIIKAEGLASRALQSINGALFRRLDHLVCLDSAMLSLLRSRYDRDHLLPATVVPNWENAAHYRPDESADASPDKEVERSRGRLVVLYCGNMGRGHCFETAIEAARMLRDEPVTFVFVGGGTRAKAILDAKRRLNLSNIVFREYVDGEELHRIMKVADCSLITLRDEMLGVMSPSKLHANLAMRLPPIYIGPKGSNVDDAINTFNCGASLRNGDSQGVADVIRNYLAKPLYLAECRARARQAFEEAYCDARVLPWFDAIVDRFAFSDARAVEEESLAILALESRGNLRVLDIGRATQNRHRETRPRKKAA